MKEPYDNALNRIAAARAALSTAGFEQLMSQTNRAPTMDQICQAVECERLMLQPTSGAPCSSLSGKGAFARIG